MVKERWPGFPHVAQDPVAGLVADRHEPFLAALAGRLEQPVLEVDVDGTQRHELGDAKASGVEQLDHRAVAHAARGVHVGRPQQRVDFVGRQEPGQGANRPRPADRRRGAGLETLVHHQVSIEGSDRRHDPRDRTRGAPLGHQVTDERLDTASIQ